MSHGLGMLAEGRGKSLSSPALPSDGCLPGLVLPLFRSCLSFSASSEGAEDHMGVRRAAWPARASSVSTRAHAAAQSSRLPRAHVSSASAMASCVLISSSCCSSCSSVSSSSSSSSTPSVVSSSASAASSSSSSSAFTPNMSQSASSSSRPIISSVGSPYHMCAASGSSPSFPLLLLPPPPPPLLLPHLNLDLQSLQACLLLPPV
mmetsp:Transcript_8846/g.32619  ORF Transcript_8846/g.32619 Transcript_8846/m.32619 type:complete len:205 (-) Transcript_8846:463-1077(-)